MGTTGQEVRQRAPQAMTSGADAPAVGTQRTARRKAGIRQRLRYRFDNSMSRGTSALVAWLVVVTFVLIVVFSGITTIFRLRSEETAPEPRGFVRELFYSLLHALDPGTVAGDEGSWRYLVTMLMLTVGGLFIVSALIGVIAAGIDEKLADLRRGRSIVLERDHTVILGWSEAIFTVIRELSLANESRNRPVIVVLSPRDKVEMEELIRTKVPDLRGTRVICRSGSPMDIDDLRISSHDTARAVILLAPEASEDPDSEVIKTLLALTHEGTGQAGIVAEIRNPTNLEAARLVGTDRTVLLDIRDTVAKLLVQTSRQSGAAAVFTELFNYDGDEIYFLEDHELGTATYGEALSAYETVSIVGVMENDRPRFNPPHDMVVGERTVIVVAEDDDDLTGLSLTSVQPDSTALGAERAGMETPTRALIIGWNDRAPIVIAEMDKYAVRGSTLVVLTSFPAPTIPPLANLAVEVVVAPTTDRETLDRHVVADLDQVMVLCYCEHLEAQAADARTLVTLLHVRDILAGLDSEIPLVSEMLDDRNRVLAEVAHVDDVVVSGEIVSLVVTQVSEDHRLEAVFDELLGDSGCEIYLRPAEWYVTTGVEVSYATVVAGAHARGETALGFKCGQDVQVNPDKSSLLRFGPKDRVVVIAES